MDLRGKVVLITGAKRIGSVVAAAVAARGADVAVAYNRSSVEAEAAAEAVRATGQRALVVPCDVTDEAACTDLVAHVDREFGRIDVLVAMASLYRAVPFADLSVQDWDQQLSVDLRGTFLVARAVVPVMKRSGTGRILAITDWVAASGRPRYKGYLAYYVAKAGVKALTEALALELAADQILVNCIAPGPILAPPGTSDAENEAVINATPLGRWGGPDEIAKTALALIDSDFITGETVRVDGGRHLN